MLLAHSFAWFAVLSLCTAETVLFTLTDVKMTV